MMTDISTVKKVKSQSKKSFCSGESHAGFALTALPGATLLKRLPNMVKKVL
jgi:hypothetical protein